MEFGEDTDNGSNKVTLQAPSILAADATVTLPGETQTLLGDKGGTLTGVLALDDSTNVSTAPPLSFDGDANTGFGHSAADTIEIVTGGVARHQIGSDGSQKSVIPGGSTLLPEFKCRAWVNFNGVGTVSIRGSGNVSSITDNGTGDYTVNFSTAMPDTNYVALATSKTIGSSGGYGFFSAGQTLATGSVRIWGARSDTGTIVDADLNSVAVFR